MRYMSIFLCKLGLTTKAVQKFRSIDNTVFSESPESICIELDHFLKFKSSEVNVGAKILEDIKPEGLKKHITLYLLVFTI